MPYLRKHMFYPPYEPGLGPGPLRAKAGLGPTPLFPYRPPMRPWCVVPIGLLLPREGPGRGVRPWGRYCVPLVLQAPFMRRLRFRHGPVMCSCRCFCFQWWCRLYWGQSSRRHLSSRAILWGSWVAGSSCWWPSVCRIGFSALCSLAEL